MNDSIYDDPKRSRIALMQAALTLAYQQADPDVDVARLEAWQRAVDSAASRHVRVLHATAGIRTIGDDDILPPLPVDKSAIVLPGEGLRVYLSPEELTAEEGSGLEFTEGEFMPVAELTVGTWIEYEDHPSLIVDMDEHGGSGTRWVTLEARGTKAHTRMPFWPTHELKVLVPKGLQEKPPSVVTTVRDTEAVDLLVGDQILNNGVVHRVLNIIVSGLGRAVAIQPIDGATSYVVKVSNDTIVSKLVPEYADGSLIPED